MLGIRRRKFISFLGGAAAWPVVARAQQARHVPIIGYVAPTNPLIPSRSTGAFLQRLRELGWIEGQTITIESRWAAGLAERLDERFHLEPLTEPDLTLSRHAARTAARRLQQLAVA
jgi:hypothetical protein